MKHLLGETLTDGQILTSKILPYKSGSFLGIGGDHSMGVKICQFNLKGNPVIVFVADNKQFAEKLQITQQFQYGFDGNELFLVWHDNHTHNIYQWRFIELYKGLSTMTSGARSISNNVIKPLTKLDLSVVAGVPLKSFA